MTILAFIDPDGSLHNYLGVLGGYATGVVYRQQCGGVEADMRQVEGYFVPVGGHSLDPSQGRVDAAELTAVFHSAGGCTYGGAAREGRLGLPAERLSALRALVQRIPYWTFQDDGEVDRRVPLRLDDARLLELLEAWVPVLTPDGPGILTWSNCD